MTIKLHRWLALLTLPFLSGCYPEGAEYVEELDLVLTNYDDSYDFSSKTTYAMPDSIIKITGDVFNEPYWVTNRYLQLSPRNLHA